MDIIKKQMMKHNSHLKEFASKDEDAYYLYDNKEDIRTPYFRDIDRILYSLSFIRYQDKTQVFTYQNTDHITNRMIHVQMVSKIARTIGRALGLNEDLIEASALGHDLGHVPFGHPGESILNELSISHKEGYFHHNIQSVRTLMHLENFGNGLNLTVQVLDAIMCHNGEIIFGKYEPVEKTKEEFLREYENSYQDEAIIHKMRPMTLEGCVVRVSDMIAYLGRDIEDGIRKNLIRREDVPKHITEVLGFTTKDIVNTIILDIIQNSYNKNYIKISDDVFKAMKDLKKFNFENIYIKAYTEEELEKLKEMFKTLFDVYLSDINNTNTFSPIVNSYLDSMNDNYKNNNTKERMVIDYIAGMTDDYFLKEYERVKNENS